MRISHWVAGGIAAMLAVGVYLSPIAQAQQGQVYPAIDPKLPTIWIIGDSTARNGQDNGSNGQWGWGNPIAKYFDTTKINVQNRAAGGTSSRTFHDGAQWAKVLDLMKKGDFVVMQFGHNDSGKPDDPARARASLPGVGPETVEIDNPITKKHETVHTYGWYLEQFVKESKDKGAADVVICSPIPRNAWTNGKVNRNTNYGGWARDAAKAAGVGFIDLNEITAKKYDALGQVKVTAEDFPDAEVVHTDWAGAIINAESVIEGFKLLDKSPVVGFLLPVPPKDLKNPSGKPR